MLRIRFYLTRPQLSSSVSQPTGIFVISQVLREAFARSYDPPHWIIQRLGRDGSAEVRDALDQALGLVSTTEIASLDHDSIAQAQILFSGDNELRARLFIVSREVAAAVQQDRLALATKRDSAPPYGHPALEGLTPDHEGLVPLAAFDIEGDALCRRDFAFFVLPGVPGSNANYWLLNEMQMAGLTSSISVRLDPLLYGPADQLHGRFYKATVYGRELDWARIRELREADHGQWMPGRLSRGFLFTDYAWIPHDREVDFLCEELPLRESVATRGTRYLHAIYDKDRHQITHLDGATRILTPSEMEARAKTHVRKAGKMGVRVKIFRTDEAIAPSTLGNLAQGFLFWNYDVARYFGAPVPPDF